MNDKIELRHLKYFVAVAEELNFGRAAQRLYITQPSLSRQIVSLEGELGFALFVRDKKQIQLTKAGQLFLTEAQQILAKFDRGMNIARRISSGELGQLRIGFQGSSVYDIIPLSIRAFREQFPQVELSISSVPTSEQIELIYNCGIDIGFIVPPISDGTLHLETILAEPLVLVLPENHPLAKDAEISLAAIANEPLVLASRDRGCGLHEQILQFYEREGLHPNVVHAAREMQVMLGFVAAGMGISLLPASVKNLQRRGIVYRILTPNAPMAELAIAWHKDNQTATLNRFLEIVRQQKNELVGFD
jgi:DNA-binding transcriptional LysR family regulator